MPGINGKLKRAVLMLADNFVVGGSLYLAFFLYFKGFIPVEYILTLERLLLPVILLNLFIFLLAGIYCRFWRYTSVDDLLVIFLAVCVGVLGSYLYSFYAGLLFPRSVYAIFLFLLLFSLVGMRLLLRVLTKYLHGRGHAKGHAPVLILGAGDAGALVAGEYKKHQAGLNVQVLGFIDDDPFKQGQVIQGFPVLGTQTKLREIVSRKGVKEIVIAMPSVSYNKLREIIKLCDGFPIKLKIVPGIYEIMAGKMDLRHLKEVEIEDLLWKPSVDSDLQEISGYLSGRKVMVTGAGGSFGSELCRQLARLGLQNIILLDQSEVDLFRIERELNRDHPRLKLYPLVRDIQDRPSLESIFTSLHPQVVFHAATNKYAPQMESNPEEATKNNILGSKNLFDLATQHGVERFVVLSTDKAVKPANVMDATKRAVEIYMQHLAQQNKNCAFCAVRFGNILGSPGSVVPLLKEQIATGGPVTVTHPEMIRYFVAIPEVVQLVIQAGAFGRKGEIFFLDMGEPIRVVDLARNMIFLSGLQPDKDIEIVFTGICPGEKMMEEPSNGKENFVLTKHRHIFMAPDTAGGEQEREAELRALGEQFNVDLLQLLGFQGQQVPVTKKTLVGNKGFKKVFVNRI